MAASAAAAVGFLAGSRCGCCFLPRPPPAREGEWRRVEGRYIGGGGRGVERVFRVLVTRLGFWAKLWAW